MEVVGAACGRPRCPCPFRRPMPARQTQPYNRKEGCRMALYAIGDLHLSLTADKSM